MPVESAREAEGGSKLKGDAPPDMAVMAARVKGEVKRHKGTGEPVVAVKWPRNATRAEKAWWFIEVE